MNASARNLALLIFLAFVWGASNLLIKLAVATMPPLMVAAVRILSALMLLLGFAWMTRARIPREVSTWRALLPVSLFGYVLPPFLIAFGQQRIDAGATAIAIGAVPIFTALLSQLVLRTERLSAMAAFGLLLGFSGIVVLIGPSAFNELDHNLAGFAAVIGAAFSYALTNIFARGTRGLNLAAAGSAVLIGASVILVPASLAADRAWMIEPSLISILATVALGLVSTGLGLILFFKLFERTGPTYVSTVNYLTPAVGVLLAVTILSEPLRWADVAALALILVGVGAVGLGRGR